MSRDLQTIKKDLERSGLEVLLITQRNSPVVNIYTKKKQVIVVEYKIRDGIGNTYHVYVLDNGNRWSIGLFSEYFTTL
jgi:hypothetical protein